MMELSVKDAAKTVAFKYRDEKVKDKIKVIRGNEIYLTRNGLSASNFSKERGDDYYHFILLAKDAEGYK